MFEPVTAAKALNRNTFPIEMVAVLGDGWDEEKLGIQRLRCERINSHPNGKQVRYSGIPLGTLPWQKEIGRAHV